VLIHLNTLTCYATFTHQYYCCSSVNVRPFITLAQLQVPIGFRKLGCNVHFDTFQMQTSTRAHPPRHTQFEHTHTLNTHTYARTHIYTHTHTLNTHTYTRTHMYTPTPTPTHTLNTHTHTYARTHIYSHTPTGHVRWRQQNHLTQLSRSFSQPTWRCWSRCGECLMQLLQF
jgi:hypothetical protein